MRIAPPLLDDMCVATADVDESLLEDVLPPAECWTAHGIRAFAPLDSFVELTVAEGRQGYVQLARATVPCRTKHVDFVVAHRMQPSGDSASMKAEGELIIAHIDGDSWVEISRTQVPASAAPSMQALTTGLYDTILFGAWQSSYGIESNENRIVKTVSWNGQYSSILAEVKRPDYVGTYTLMLDMSDDDNARTSAALSEWPQPVWFIRARWQRP